MPDTIEATRPTQREVTKEQVITTPDAEHDATIARVEQFLVEQNPNGPVARAKAITAETPIPQSPELDAVKAERLGSEEPDFSGKDLRYTLEAALEPVTGRKAFGRVGNPIAGIKAFLRRNKDKALVPKEEGKKIELTE